MRNGTDFRLLCAAVAIVLTVPVTGCGLMRRGNLAASTSVEVSSGGRDIATIERGEYKLLGVGEGEAKARRWFLLWFPIGNQETQQELETNAAFDAVTDVKDCDEILFPHTKTRRLIIPLLLVTVVIKKVELRGRCIALKPDNQLRSDREADIKRGTASDF